MMIVADLVDLGVGGGVDLEDVDVAALRDLDAGVADAAGIGGRTLLAVQAAREDARRRRLADAARAGEDERLGDAAGGNRVAQRLRDAALADDVVEALRPPFPSKDLIGRHVETVMVRGRPVRSTATRRGLRHMSVSA